MYPTIGDRLSIDMRTPEFEEFLQKGDQDSRWHCTPLSVEDVLSRAYDVCIVKRNLPREVGFVQYNNGLVNIIKGSSLETPHNRSWGHHNVFCKGNSHTHPNGWPVMPTETDLVVALDGWRNAVLSRGGIAFYKGISDPTDPKRYLRFCGMNDISEIREGLRNTREGFPLPNHLFEVDLYIKPEHRNQMEHNVRLIMKGVHATIFGLHGQATIPQLNQLARSGAIMTEYITASVAGYGMLLVYVPANETSRILKQTTQFLSKIVSVDPFPDKRIFNL